MTAPLINFNAEIGRIFDEAAQAAAARPLVEILRGPSPIRNKRDRLLSETKDAQDEFLSQYDAGSKQYALDALKDVSDLAAAWLAFEAQAKATFAKLNGFDGLANPDWLENAQEAVGEALDLPLTRVFAAYVAEQR